MQKNTGTNLQHRDKIESLGISTYNFRDIFKMVGWVTDKRIEAELSELLPRKIYDQPTQSFGIVMKGIANGTMANESIVLEALHMPVLCKDIEVLDKDGRTKRAKATASNPPTYSCQPLSAQCFLTVCDDPLQGTDKQ